MSRINKYIIDGEKISHDELRITDFDTLSDFLLNIANVPYEVDEDVYEFIAKTGYNYFQLSGDGDGLGFIVDVFNNRELEGEPVDSLQVWLDEYKEFM